MCLIKLTINELFKVWRQSTFCLLLAALLLINLFLLWVITNPTEGALSSGAYRTMQSDLQDMTMHEKDDYIHSQLEKAKALSTIESVLQIEAWNGGRQDEYMRKQYASEFENYFEIYENGDFLRYNDTLAKEYTFLNKIALEFETVNGYDDYLIEIDAKANQLSGISIFAESEDGYDLKNIEKTAKAYDEMHGIEIDYMPQMGVFTALDFELTDLILIFAMLLIATVLIRNERDSGLFHFIRSMPNGRLYTAFAKLFAFGISMLFVLILLYGVNLAYCHLVYGIGDLNRAIQSVPFLMRSNLKISVGEYFALFLLVKWAAAMIAGFWVMLAMLCAKRPVTGIISASLLLFFNLIIRTIIPATSNLNVLKYANLISLLRVNELIGSYRNLYFFANPVSIITVESITAIVSALLFTTLFCMVFSKAYLTTKHGNIFNFKLAFIRKKVHTSVFKTEWHKIFIMNGAIIFIAIFAFYSIYNIVTTETYIDPEEIYYSFYMKNLQGSIDDEMIAKMEEFSAEFMPIYELEHALQTGKITSEEYQMALSAYWNLTQKKEVYDEIYHKLYDLSEKPRAQLVYESGYLSLFDFYDVRDKINALLTSVITILCFAGFFAMEKQTGMVKVVASTPLGRSITVKNKLKITTIICVISTLISASPQFIIVCRDYGLGAIFAPVYSIDEFSNAFEIPLVFLLIIYFLARFIAIKFIASVSLFFSQKLGNMFAAVFCTLGVFILPLLLSITGFEMAKWISVYPAFHACAMFENKAESVAVMIILTAFCFGVYICENYLYEKFGRININ